MPPLLDWACNSPWLAAWLAWPVASVLVAAAWFFAETTSRGFNTLVYLANLASNTIVILLRGYAPQSAEAHPEDEDDDPKGDVS
jgi:hypothetical protein